MEADFILPRTDSAPPIRPVLSTGLLDRLKAQRSDRLFIQRDSPEASVFESPLMEGWLLVPPQDQSITPGILAFDNLWKPIYAFLTPHHLGVIPDPDRDETLMACQVADVRKTERLDGHEQTGFAPFRLELVDGEPLFFATTDPLESSLWLLKLENARSGAYRRDMTPESTTPRLNGIDSPAGGFDLYAGSFIPPAADSLRSPAGVEQQHPLSLPRAPNATARERFERVQELFLNLETHFEKRTADITALQEAQARTRGHLVKMQQMAHGATVTRQEALQAITEKLQALQVTSMSPPPPAPSTLSHTNIPYVQSRPLPAVPRAESAAARSRAGIATTKKAKRSTAGNLRRVLAPGGPEKVAMKVWESLEAQLKGGSAAPSSEPRGKGAIARTNKLESRR